VGCAWAEGDFATVEFFQTSFPVNTQLLFSTAKPARAGKRFTISSEVQTAVGTDRTTYMRV
jgi:hypothetical protein